MSAENPAPQKKRGLLIALVAGAFALGALGAAALLVNIAERKQEAKNPYRPARRGDGGRRRPGQVGDELAARVRRLQAHLRADEHEVRRRGSAAPKGSLPPQKAERDPWLKRIFAGYLFAVDYRDRRGHAFMLFDQENTKRNVPAEGKQSGNCLHCHASIMPLYRKLGREAAPKATEAEQIQKGLVARRRAWATGTPTSSSSEVSGGKAHPVSCVDCHDPKSMEMRVTRPAFITGIQKLAASNAAAAHLPSIETWRKGRRAGRTTRTSTPRRQEKRSYVCAQCHVEYFCGKGTTIFFPWGDGLKVEEIEKQLRRDRRSRRSGSRTGRTPRPGWRSSRRSTPSSRSGARGSTRAAGVACADCHMSYKRDGAQKISEHWVRSPLLSANRSCATCHPNSDEELKAPRRGDPGPPLRADDAAPARSRSR